VDAIRSFIAIDLAPATIREAQRLIARLQTAAEDVTWVHADNMHLTLKFLGEVPSVETPAVCRAVADAVAGFPPFEIRCRGAGAFPDLQRPRTAWLGITDGRESLGELQAAIDDAMSRLGFARERRGFHPHLTLGRVRQSGPQQRELGRMLAHYDDFDAGISEINEVIVYASFLDRTGPTYRPMGRSTLAG
jgi:2'-5' RNA ligase